MLEDFLYWLLAAVGWALLAVVCVFLIGIVVWVSETHGGGWGLLAGCGAFGLAMATMTCWEDRW